MAPGETQQHSAAELADQQAASQFSQDFFDPAVAKQIDEFCRAAGGEESFRKPSQNMAHMAKLCLKALYDFSSSQALPPSTAGLPELHVEGFEAEQIWGQLEASSGPTLKHLRRKFRKLGEDIALLDANTESALDELLLQANGGNILSGSETSEDSEVSLHSSEDEEEDLRNSAKEQPQTNMRRRSAGEEEDRKLLPTEDSFLRLDDMERFVQDAEAADLRENARDTGEEDESVEGDDDDSGGSDMEGLNPNALGPPDQSDKGLQEESNSDEEDAELARLLESASGMAASLPQDGGSRKKKRKFDSDDEITGDGGEQQAYYYDDFFGRGGPRHRDADEYDDKLASLGDNLPSGDVSGGEGLDSPGADLSEEESEGDERDAAEEEGSEAGSDEDQDLEIDEGEADAREALMGSLQNLLDQKRAEEAGGKGTPTAADIAGMSAHERRVARMADRARKLEEENLGEKQWFMRGEARAGARPLNSALEIDMDFDRALKPPPQPTEEFTTSLEDLIKRRIADQQFDDPARREAAPEVLQKQLAELDDKRSAKGLGEVYEEEFVRARAGNVVEDKDEQTRAEARLVLKTLFAKLDALSHFHFAPKPIIKDMSVQREVPALTMEEVAPQVLSEAARQLPEEIYKTASSTGAKEDQLHGRSERRRRRGAAKRLYRKKTAGQANGMQKIDEDGANIIGRKSAQEDSLKIAARKKEQLRQKRKRSKLEDGPKQKFTKSASVFKQIEDAKANKSAIKTPGAAKSANLKL